MLSKNRHNFAKLPNQNICSQTLSKFAKFQESGDKFANVATLSHADSKLCEVITEPKCHTKLFTEL